MGGAACICVLWETAPLSSWQHLNVGSSSAVSTRGAPSAREQNSTENCQERAHEMGNTRGWCALAGRTGGVCVGSIGSSQQLLS